MLLKDFARERGTSRHVDGGAYLAYDPVPIFGGAEELSFEELRGQAWKARDQERQARQEQQRQEEALRQQQEAEIQQAQAPPPQRPPTSVFAVYDDDDHDAENMPPNLTAGASRNGNRTITQHLSFSGDSSLGPGAAAAATPLSPSPRDAPRNMPSPTINTKEALAEVMAMFGHDSTDTPASAALQLSTIAEQSTLMNTSAAPHASTTTSSRSSSASLMGGFAIHEDSPAGKASAPRQPPNENNDENGENVPPPKYTQPIVTAAAEAAAKYNQPRSILGVVPGFTVESADEDAPDAAGSSPTIPDGQDDVVTKATEPSSSFGDIMKNLGLAIPSRHSRNATSDGDATAMEENAATLAPPGMAPPATKPSPGGGECGFAIFEDPPTCKVNTDGVSFFAASTPFTCSTAGNRAKPCETPIIAPTTATRSSGDVHPDAADAGVFPFGSTAPQNAPPASSTGAGVAWPLTADAAQKLVAEIWGRTVPGCTTESENTCPHALQNGDIIAFDAVGTSVKVVEALSPATATASAASYLVVDAAAASTSDTSMVDSDDDDCEAAPQMRLTVAHPACLWEYAVLRRLAGTSASGAGGGVLASIPTAHAAVVRGDGSMALFAHPDDYTMRDVVAMHGKVGKPMEETLVMYYAIELLRVVQLLHGNDIVHSRITPEHVVLRNNGDDDDWSILYDPAGGGGWSSKGVCLTAFDQAVDLTALPAGAAGQRPQLTSVHPPFVSMNHTGSQWTFEVPTQLSVARCCAYQDRGV